MVACPGRAEQHAADEAVRAEAEDAAPSAQEPPVAPVPARGSFDEDALVRALKAAGVDGDVALRAARAVAREMGA